MQRSEGSTTQNAMFTAALTRRALRLEYLTIGWNAAEAGVALTAGIRAGSIALIGFGLDSVIEVFAACVVVWQLRGAMTVERDRLALRLIALSFYLLAAYVAVDALRDLIGGSDAGESTVGIVMAVIALFPHEPEPQFDQASQNRRDGHRHDVVH